LFVDSEHAILSVLDSFGELSLPRISELSKLSELETSSTLAGLVSQGYVGRSRNVFKISFSGKEHLKELRKTSGK
jgi:hypothetical protein